MKKMFFMFIAFMMISFVVNAHPIEGKYRADKDAPSLNISKGDIVYISVSKGEHGYDYSFENLSNFTSFIARAAGGMGGFINGYNVSSFIIKNISWHVQIRYNDEKIRMAVDDGFSLTRLKE